MLTITDTIPKPPPLSAVYPMVVESGVERPDVDPRRRGQWTKGDLLLWIPNPDLRFEDIVPPDAYPDVMNWVLTGWRKQPTGWHLSLRPTRPGQVEFRFVGQAGHKFLYQT